MRRTNLFIFSALHPIILFLSGCGEATTPVSREDLSGDTPAWETFKAQSKKLDGHYIVDGDLAVDETSLRRYYDDEYVNPVEKSSVARKNGVDLLWSSTEKLSIGYCISNSWSATMKPKVIADMRQAAAQWMSAANVIFTYLPQRDASCAEGYTGVNNDIKINVLPGTGSYATYPHFDAGGNPSEARFVHIYEGYTNNPQNGGGFGVSGVTVLGVFTHELGHALGLVHEHWAAPCNSPPEITFRLINSYDASSVMHYPNVVGCPSTPRNMTNLDKAGLASLYGAPANAVIGVLPTEWLLATGSALL